MKQAASNKKQSARRPKKVKKSAAKKLPQIKVAKKPEVKPERYFQALGRRKTAVARIRLFTKGEKSFTVNGKPLEVYFPLRELQKQALAPLAEMGFQDKFAISAFVSGGGFRGQAEALRHGVARALVLFSPELKKPLKKAGFLTRDPRMRERKKFGLKRARRAPQWAKR